MEWGLANLFTRSCASFASQVNLVLGRKITSMLPSDMEILKPPNASHLKTLKREAFRKEITIPCLKVSGPFIEKLRTVIQPILLKLPNLKPILPGEETVVLLNPLKILAWSDLDEKVRNKMAEMGLTEQNFTSAKIELNYNNWNADDILRAILPPGVEIARSFSKVGHIIHLNLRDHLLIHKQIIGEVLLDKTPNSKTVVNKTTKIDNTYRNFEMELICGEDNMVTQVRENGFDYQFDFSQVYWNPRLSTEHQRVVDSTSPGDVLFDVFCGVGPFAVPCAKKKCKVYANDLNPNCHSWLDHNVKLNKINKEYIETFNKDGSEFITTDVKKQLLNLARDSHFSGKTHVTMNLPALALDFVKHFKHLIPKDEAPDADLERVAPRIHVYFFVLGTNPCEAAKKAFSACLGSPFLDSMSYQYVRNVSPKKDMVKISFTPSLSFLVSPERGGELVAKKHDSELEGEAAAKKSAPELEGEPAAKKLCGEAR